MGCRTLCPWHSDPCAHEGGWAGRGAPRTLCISARGTDQAGLGWLFRDRRLLVSTAMWWSLRMTMQRSCAAMTSVTLSSCAAATSVGG